MKQHTLVYGRKNNSPHSCMRASLVRVVSTLLQANKGLIVPQDIEVPVWLRLYRKLRSSGIPMYILIEYG